ncbi:Sodium:dicarboxylate symporter [Neoconidiobolus thromboides FSU 785]|nr:Sodium:dicarboxylate symporter [Neoconidiobolus thromboides FSU 785]
MSAARFFRAIFRPFGPVWRLLRKTNVTIWIFIFMVIGLILGFTVSKEVAYNLNFFSKAFLELVKCLIVPLIFSTLVVGIAGHGDDLAKVGRLALKSLIYFEVVTTLALIIGLIAVNVIGPGWGIDLSNVEVDKDIKKLSEASENITWHHEMFEIVTPSFFESAVKNKVLQIVFCAIMFSVAMIKTKPKYRKPMVSFLESLSQIMFKVTELVMNFAPIGIGCALCYTINTAGGQVLINLGKLIGTLYGSLVIFMLIILLPIMLICRLPLINTFKAIGEPALIAFSTASSEAALPKAMENMERLGVPKGTVAFVMPTGYSFNLDGTTLYLSLASIFCAQAGGISMPIGEQIVMMLSLMLTSKGVAAVPRASLVILTGTVHSFNLPMAAITVILGVDALMDMGRTTVNLIGNCLAAIVMSVWEGDFDYEIARGLKPFIEEDFNLDEMEIDEKKDEKMNPKEPVTLQEIL